MNHRIRDVRRAKGLTLEDVAKRCSPPTSAQTIGRLETGTRTLSIGWVNRIAAALEVDAAQLLSLTEQGELPVAAVLDHDGVHSLTAKESLLPPTAEPDMVALRVKSSLGDYRAGDAVWCRQIAAAGYAQALNRDVLVPRPAGRFFFGRLIGREAGQLLILPLGAGQRQQVVLDPAWIGVAERLVRPL